MNPEYRELPEGWSRHPSTILDEEVAQRFIDGCVSREVDIVNVQHIPEGENVGSLHVYTPSQVCILQYNQDVIDMDVEWLSQQGHGNSFHFTFN